LKTILGIANIPNQARVVAASPLPTHVLGQVVRPRVPGRFPRPLPTMVCLSRNSETWATDHALH
jgi:hypothetical protein